MNAIHSYHSLYKAREGVPLWGMGPSSYVARHVPLGFVGATALDLGCGDGRNAFHLARLGYDVLAIDYDETAIGLAHSHAKAETMCLRPNFLLEDVRDLRWIGDYRVIVAYGLFHCLGEEDLRRVIRAMADSQAAGDWLVVAALTDGLPIPPGHGTVGVTLRSGADYSSLLGQDWELVESFVSKLSEDHRPAIGVHVHEIYRGAWRRKGGE